MHTLIPRITNHFRALGCSVARSAVKRKADEEKAPLPTHTATLRIPLNFPKPRKNKKLRNWPKTSLCAVLWSDFCWIPSLLVWCLYTALVLLRCRKSDLFDSGVGSLPCVCLWLIPVCGECHACLQLWCLESKICAYFRVSDVSNWSHNESSETQTDVCSRSTGRLHLNLCLVLVVCFGLWESVTWGLVLPSN